MNLDPNTTVTLGVVATAVILILAGWRAAWWITRFSTKMKSEFFKEISSLRESVDVALKDQREKQRDFERENREGLRAIERDLGQFKLDVSKHYATKSDIEHSTRLILAEMKTLLAEHNKK